jgi:hypothetical protein
LAKAPAAPKKEARTAGSKSALKTKKATGTTSKTSKPVSKTSKPAKAAAKPVQPRLRQLLKQSSLQPRRLQKLLKLHLHQSPLKASAVSKNTKAVKGSTGPACQDFQKGIKGQGRKT